MTGTRDRTKTKKMTKKWQNNDRDKWQDKKKTTKANDKKNDNANDKIIIFMYPSVWLQVPSKVMWYKNGTIGRMVRYGTKSIAKTKSDHGVMECWTWGVEWWFKNQRSW